MLRKAINIIFINIHSESISGKKIIEYSSDNFSNVIFVGNDKLSITE